MQLNLSIGKILLLTYIIIASSFCSNLFSNGLKKAIESNRFVQHIILILLIMSLMIFFGNPFGVEISTNHTINIVIITLLVYVWFILTTKLDLAWNVAIIILLTIYFLYESKVTSDINIELKDTIVPAEKKNDLINNFVTTNNYFLMSIFSITVIGTFFYTSEKQVQYGGGFSPTNFWFN